jgi:AcrB/AcrD/AcrF family
MIGGMLPSAFGLGSGGEFRAPMAIAVIGGLMSSTLLSLLFVPAVFSVMDDIGAGLWRVFGRFVGDAEETAIPAEPPDRRARPRDLPIAAE